MALVGLRSTFARANCIGGKLGRPTCGLLSANSRHVVAPIQVAGMKATYGEKYPYSKPWPYETKDFNTLHELYDRSLARMNENSKVILVEGNVGVGKHELAKRIAKDFDLKYFPAAPDTNCFLYAGYDLRDLDQMLPESARSYDLAKFLADPHPELGTAGRLQVMWYQARFMEYANALLHLFSTGQGVVLVRSPYTDMVFPEAMRSQGWVTRRFMKYYRLVYDNTICELLNPHITIYLEAPIPVLRERIKARNNPLEMNSKNLTDGFLQAITDAYRTKVLPKLRNYGEVLEVDWSEASDENDIDVIVEAIQELELECDSNEDTKFHDWFEPCDDDIAEHRKTYTQRDQVLEHFRLPLPWDCPEVMFSEEDRAARKAAYETHPALMYQPGWSPQLGDKTMMKLF